MTIEPTDEMIDKLCEWRDARGQDADRDRNRHLFRAVLEIAERCGASSGVPDEICQLGSNHSGRHAANVTREMLVKW